MYGGGGGERQHRPVCATVWARYETLDRRRSKIESVVDGAIGWWPVGRGHLRPPTSLSVRRAHGGGATRFRGHACEMPGVGESTSNYGGHTMTRSMRRPHPRVAQPGPVPAFRRFPSQKVRHTFPVPDGWPAGKRAVGVAPRPGGSTRVVLPEPDEDEEENTQEANTKGGDGLAIQWIRPRRRSGDTLSPAASPTASGFSRLGSPRILAPVFADAPSPKLGTFQAPKRGAHDEQISLFASFTSSIAGGTSTVALPIPTASRPSTVAWGREWGVATSSCRRTYALHTHASTLRTSRVLSARAAPPLFSSYWADLLPLPAVPQPPQSARPWTTDGTTSAARLVPPG